MRTCISTSTKHVYAIKSGLFVEFRLAEAPPKPRVSKITKSLNYGETFVMSHTFYVGGTVLGFIAHAKFVRQFHRNIARNKMVCLSVDDGAKVLSADWRSKNL